MHWRLVLGKIFQGKTLLVGGLLDTGVIFLKTPSALPQDKPFGSSLSFPFDFEYLGIGCLLFAHSECLYQIKNWERRGWLLVSVLGQVKIEPTLLTEIELFSHGLTLIKLRLASTALQFII